MAKHLGLSIMDLSALFPIHWAQVKRALGLIKADNLDFLQKCNVEKGYISVSAGDIKRLREEKVHRLMNNKNEIHAFVFLL